MNKEEILENIAEHYLDSFRKGKAPPFSYYVRKCPNLEGEIVDLLKSLKQIERFSTRETVRKSTIERSQTKRSTKTLAVDSLGEFEIVRQIGQGGMGTVYLAADKVLDRRVALKVLDVPADSGRERVERFRREAKLASRLHHTNIVPVFGVGSQGQYCYYAMQYINGVDVRQVIDALRGRDPDHHDFSQNLFEEAQKLIHTDTGSTVDRPGSTEDGSVRTEPAIPTRLSEAAEVPNDQSYWLSVARIGVQVSDALHYAHANDIVHRDIKPSNLLMDRSGTVWVTDFGLAKLSDSEDLTRTDNLLGTLRYMAPEQLSGKHSRLSDVYALGVTLYELLTLRPACDATTYAALLNQKKEAAFKVPREIDSRIPRDLETIILKSMHPDKEARYQSALEMGEDLRCFLADRPITARRTTLAEQAFRWCRKNRHVAALLALVATLLCALPMVLGVAYYREATERVRAEEILLVAMEGFDEFFSSVVDRDFAITENDIEIEASTSRNTPLRITPDSGIFLQRMLTLYDQLKERDARGNTQLLVESAKANWRVADIYQVLGQYDEALAAYEDAKRRYQDLPSSDGKEFAIQLASIETERGKILSASQKYEEAEAVFNEALELLAQSTNPDAIETRIMLARVHLYLGRPEQRGPPGYVGDMRNRPPRRGIPGFDRPWSQNSRPQDFSAQDFRAQNTRLSNSGLQNARLANSGPPGTSEGRSRPLGAEAEGSEQVRLEQVAGGQSPGGAASPTASRDQRPPSQHLVQALNIIDGLLEQNTESEQIRFMRALCLRDFENPGVFHEEDGSKRAEAVELLQQLADEYPGEMVYRFELSQTLRNVSPHRISPEDSERAIEQLLAAKELSERLVEDAEQVAIYQINLAHIYAHLGMLYDRQNDLRDSETYSRLAVSTHHRVADNFPGLRSVSRQLLAGPSLSLAALLMRRQQDFEAAVVLEELHHSLTDTIATGLLQTHLLGRAQQELAACEEMQDRIDLDRPPFAPPPQ